jgi:hypothetical protein
MFRAAGSGSNFVRVAPKGGTLECMCANSMLTEIKLTLTLTLTRLILGMQIDPDRT